MVSNRNAGASSSLVSALFISGQEVFTRSLLLRNALSISVSEFDAASVSEN